MVSQLVNTFHRVLKSQTLLILLVAFPGDLSFFSCRDQALLAVDTLPTGSKLCHKLSGVAFQKPHHLK